MKDELVFYDVTTKQIMMIKVDDPYKGWLFRKHSDGQWVCVRMATKEDMFSIIKISEKGLKKLKKLLNYDYD